MAKLTISYEARMRDEFGRFRAVYNAAEERAVGDAVGDLEDLARAWAPSRSGELRGSIVSAHFGKSGVVGATADHAPPQEFGAGPHTIPNAFGVGPVQHPGNPATHFLGRAAEAMRDRFVRAIERAFPA